jgi:hypothetical protein
MRSQEIRTAGDAIPPNCAVIEVHVVELRQLFNAIDPSPFRERDLDPKAEEFIVGWSREVPADSRLALLVNLDRPAGRPDEAALLREAVHGFFAGRAAEGRRRLRRLFHLGRVSLVIGLSVLAVCVGLAQLVVKLTGGSALAEVLHESLLIGGWVAMWRPLEVFLYDWWPIRADIRLFGRLAGMPVTIRYPDAAAEADAGRWQRDWPAIAPAPLPQGTAARASRPGETSR